MNFKILLGLNVYLLILPKTDTKFSILEKDITETCINNAIGKLFNNSNDLLIIYSDVENNYTYPNNMIFYRKPMVHLNLNLFFGQLRRPFVHFVIFVEDFDSFKNDIDQLMLSSFWNDLHGPRGNYFIINDGLDETRLMIFKHLWKLQIYKVVIMQSNLMNDSDDCFYVANPFCKKNRDNIEEEILGSCQNLINLTFINYMFLMDEQDFVYSTGYFYLPYTGEPHSKYQGITLSLLDLIETKLNINVIYHISSKEENNEFYETGMTNTTRDCIYNGTYQAFFISNLYYHYYETYELTDSALYENQMWIIATPPLKNSAEILFSMFTLQSWICLILTCITFTFIFWIIAIIEVEKRCKEMNFSFLVIFGTTLGVVVASDKLKSKYLKVLIIMNLFYSTVLFNMMHGSMSSLFANPGYQKGISTFEEMVNSDIIPYWNMQKIALIKNQTNPLARKLSEKSVPYDSVTSPRNRVKFVKTNRNCSTTAYDTYLQLYGTKGIRIIGHQFLIPHEVIFGMRKGNPFIPYINRIINIIVQSGLVIKWVDGMKDHTEYAYDIGGSNEHAIILTVSHLKIIFDLLFYGLTIATIVFISELIFHKYGKYVMNKCKSLMKSE